MPLANVLVLTLVVFAFAVFALALAYGSVVARGDRVATPAAAGLDGESVTRD